MKIFLKSTVIEIKKIVESSGFWLSVALGVVFMLSCSIYEDKGTSYNVITAIINLDPDIYAGEYLSRQQVFYTITGSSLAMYGTALAALAFTGVYCRDKKNNIKRYTIIRMGKNTEAFSKAVGAIVSVGMAFALISLISLIVVWIFFPDISCIDDGEVIMDMYSRFSDGTKIGLYNIFSDNAFYIIQILGQMLYGMFCGVVGFMVVTFSRNIYICVSIPFFVGYTYYTIYNSVLADFASGNLSGKVCDFMNKYITWTNFTCFTHHIEYFGANMFIFVCLWGISILIYRVRSGLMKDKGGA